ncbi:MAG: hypothetical protein KJS92_02015 [Bacteroidetes bacterium]|nr:hypothetical protein [Bacteroidota bacterium]
MRFKVKTLLWLLPLLFACKPEEARFPKVPGLSFSSYDRLLTPDGRDSLLFLNFNYTDGDGDLGLNDGDSAGPFQFGSPFFYNFDVKFFELVNGKFVSVKDPLTNDTLNFNQRLPRMTPSGIDKQIEGSIRITVPAQPSGFKPDSVQYRCRLKDRALNQSVEVSTPVIALRQ